MTFLTTFSKLIQYNRYDDNLVELLEGWEQRTRSAERGIGHRAHDARADREEKEGEVALEKIFEDGTWDNKKMVRSFARMGITDPGDVTEVKASDKEVRPAIISIYNRLN